MDMSSWDDENKLFEMTSETQLEFDSLSSMSGGFSERVLSPAAPMTPPASHSGSPESEERKEGNSFISVSTTFYPGANTDTLPTDLIILSSDSVFFYVHSGRLLAASDNGFNQMLPLAAKRKDTSESDPILNLPELSTVLNILLHTVYGMSCSHYYPSLKDLSSAVTAMKLYGVPLQNFVSPNSPLALTILSNAPLAPLDVYALAASNNLHALAVSASSHLLSFPLPTLTDEQVSNVGPIYLKKLFFLHLGRTDALKRLLLPPPHPHPETAGCDFMEQKKLTRAWTLASAYLMWDARPDTSVSAIEAVLSPLGEHLSCGLCKTALTERIRDLIVQWTQIKTTV